MCGINGIYNFNDKCDTQGLVHKMNETIRFRGPDHEAVTNINKCNLGHVRLSIIDTSSRSNQPFECENKRYFIVFNGEIYNYTELKEQFLNDVVFTTQSDTEVLLKLYIKLGVECLNHLNGMFAFGIYDALADTLFIARDQFGIKPIYYHKSNNQLIFSSSVKAILSTNLIEREINQSALTSYLRFQTVQDPNTIIKELYSLDSGHYLFLENNEITKHCYYDQGFKSSQTVKDSPAVVRKKIQELFFNSVQFRMRADVPFGAFLSGGIDSGAVVAAMRQQTEGSIKSFSIVFDDPKYDERKYARIIAQKYNTTHKELLLKPELLISSVSEALKYMDHPTGDGINTFLVSKITKEQQIKMVLSGLGGDELFAGYAHFKSIYFLFKNQWLFKIPLAVRKLIAKIIGLVPSKKSEKYLEILTLQKFNINALYEIFRSTFSHKQIKNLLKNKTELIQGNLKGQQQHSENHILSDISRLELQAYLKNTLLRDTDMMSMAHGLEVRVPFLDVDFVEYVMSVPDELKFPDIPKKLFVESMANLIPNEIINRPKMGFVLPWDSWLRNQLKPMVELNLQTLGNRTYFNESYIQQLWIDFLHKKNGSVSWSRIWSLIALELWLKENQIQ